MTPKGHSNVLNFRRARANLRMRRIWSRSHESSLRNCKDNMKPSASNVLDLTTATVAGIVAVFNSNTVYGVDPAKTALRPLETLSTERRGQVFCQSVETSRYV
jgi:hypothetical protein